MVNQSPAETALSRAMIRWSLSKATPVSETATSWLYRVEQNGRKTAALKIIKLDAGEDERRGGELLAWYAGEGAVTVFDSAENAVFMEWVDGVTLAVSSRAGGDDEATIAICNVVSQLHRPRDGAPKGLTPLQKRFEILFDTSARVWPNTARDLFARSVGIGLGMFDKPTAVIPLHGDIHHENILSSDRDWLAIDPKGLLGDPAYEVANVFQNPVGAEKLVANPERVSRLADMFAERLGMNRKRVLGWAAAHTALSACWDIAEGSSITLQLAVLPHLLAAYDAA
jgi:streptomycin 6-kinase